eukprot:scaffold7210_cov20-Prasinocladus_malaysianus.AAC.2
MVRALAGHCIGPPAGSFLMFMMCTSSGLPVGPPLKCNDAKERMAKQNWFGIGVLMGSCHDP